MREILFRGKDVYGKWLYGDLINLTGEIKQICNHTQLEHAHGVNPETVGQFTGLTDKNGKRIFEGDIVQAEISGGAYDGFRFPVGVIVFENGSFCIKDSKTVTPLGCYAPRVTFEIIGNVHDNPELLIGEGK